MAPRSRAKRQTPSNLSATDQHAKRIAAAIAKGRSPLSSPDLDHYFASSSREIFAAFEGAARHLSPASGNKALAFGYLFILRGLLEHLRYGTDRGYAEPAALIAEFQAAIAAQAGQIDRDLLAFVTVALQQANIAASPELAAATAARIVDDGQSAPPSADIDATIAEMIDACGSDPFALVVSLAEFSHAVPDEVRGGMAASLALSKSPAARAAAVLFLLDPDSAVRGAAAKVLMDGASALAPTDVRRLIAMRNWRPESERAAVDAIVRNARTAGIDCAAWPPGDIEVVLASAIDGVSSQGFLLVSPAGRKKRLSSVLAKVGVADAWSGEPETHRRIEASLRGAGMDMPMLPVSRSYLDRVVAHHLALGIEKGRVPPVGLLQVAETIGGANWQPASMDFGETLAELMTGIPKRMREAAAVTTVLQRSDQLSDLEPIAQSWFEDDPEIARIVASGRGASAAKRATYLLQTVMVRRRDKWADLFLRTAAWLHDVSAGGDLCWRELAIVAKAVAEGRDLSEIGLMRDIALRTIAVLGAVRVPR